MKKAVRKAGHHMQQETFVVTDLLGQLVSRKVWTVYENSTGRMIACGANRRVCFNRWLRRSKQFAPSKRGS
jgi:hypothetical protein